MSDYTREDFERDLGYVSPSKRGDEAYTRIRAYVSQLHADIEARDAVIAAADELATTVRRDIGRRRRLMDALAQHLDDALAAYEYQRSNMTETSCSRIELSKSTQEVE